MGRKQADCYDFGWFPWEVGGWDLLKQEEPGSLAAPFLQHCVMPTSGPLGHDNKRLGFFFSQCVLAARREVWPSQRDFPETNTSEKTLMKQ